MPEAIFRFAEGLRRLLEARSARELERHWSGSEIEETGWEALSRARRLDAAHWECVLDEVDGLLLCLLDRLPVLSGESDPAAARVRTFREPALERLQHGTAAALVAQRYGVAGLRTVLADEEAPLARRYFAFLALAERHPPTEWGVFARYLTPDAHHAFVGAAAEAARFYPDHSPAPRLVELFQAVRADQHLRAFLSPRILESLYVLADRRTLPFFRHLLIAGHTHSDPERCEVTRALVMVRCFTGKLEPSTKYSNLGGQEVPQWLDEAQSLFEVNVEHLQPVLVI